MIVLIAFILLLLLSYVVRLAMRVAPRLWRSMLTRLINSEAARRAQPLRELFAARFPRTASFVRARLNTRTFTGLPLTLLCVAAFYIVALLGGIVEELVEADEMIALDAQINAAFSDYRSADLVSLFAKITDLGSFTTLLAVALVSTGFLWAHASGRLILPLWLTVVGAQLTTTAGKYGFDRARPEFLTEVTAITPSFPSGHSTGAMAVYGFIAYAIARDLASRRARFEVAYWTVALIALVGFSRIFLSVHYLSDVAAGLLVGGFWLLLGFTVAEYRRPSHTSAAG